MTSSWDLPEQGIAVWPVGNGDSITVAVDLDNVIQIDINHRQEAEKDDDDRVPVIDRLKDVLPKTKTGKVQPRLAVLAITHHDEDHCSGFGRLVDEVQVDELWVTLRSFVEDKDKEGGLTEAGQAVYDEACRRRQAEIEAHAEGKRAKAGDRLRIIGYHDVIENDEWEGFPDDLVTVPGNLIPDVNTLDLSDKIELFVHTPFKDDCDDGSRNSSTLGLQITLIDGDDKARFLLLGDLEYEQIEAFYDRSAAKNADRLEWDLLLAPHHCSRNAICRQDGDVWVDADAYTDLKDSAAAHAVVVVSSRSFDDIKGKDTNPPHEDARTAYERMVGKENVCWTADNAKGTDSDPVTFTVTEGTLSEKLSK